MPWVVVFGDGPPARVGDGVAGPEVVAEGEAVVGAAVGDGGAEGGGVEGAGDAAPGRFPAPGACRWRARITAAPTTRRAQATMTATFSWFDEIGMAGLRDYPACARFDGGWVLFIRRLEGRLGLLSGALRGASGEPVRSPHERLR